MNDNRKQQQDKLIMHLEQLEKYNILIKKERMLISPAPSKI